MKAASALALATLLSVIATSALAQDVMGVVKRSSGSVVFERSGSQVAVAPGTVVLRGDRLVTGADGYASIRMYGAAPLSVGPGIDVGLDRYAQNHRPVVERPVPAILQGLASFLAINRQP